LHGAGESQIVAPDGTVVAKGPRTGEAVVVADIDPSLADGKRRADGLDIFAARRPELYGPIGHAPRGRRLPAGAASLPVAVVRGGDAVAEAARAAAEGALLIVTPAADPALLATALTGTPTHAVTLTPDGVALVDGTGVIGLQRPLHDTGSGVDLADDLLTFDLPWGRLALIGGADTLFPEVYRLAALSDVDVVASPWTAAEAWELALGLPERAAENRLNVIAAAPLDQPSAVLALSPDFTLWTAWQGPFTGRISHPVVHEIPAGTPAARADVAPAQAANRLVSRRTDLVDGRPWRLVSALTER
jgi:predicted amidohydrolase